MSQLRCKGICARYNVKRTVPPSQLTYERGFKRCRHCGVWYNTSATRCICCHHLLRTHPLSKTGKKK